MCRKQFVDLDGKKGKGMQLAVVEPAGWPRVAAATPKKFEITSIPLVFYKISNIYNMYLFVRINIKSVG
jgi:hypothetical protein